MKLKDRASFFSFCLEKPVYEVGLVRIKLLHRSSLTVARQKLWDSILIHHLHLSISISFSSCVLRFNRYRLYYISVFRNVRLAAHIYIFLSKGPVVVGIKL